jgi:hypothetical protein
MDCSRDLLHYKSYLWIFPFEENQDRFSMLPLGEFTSIEFFMAHKGILCLLTNGCDMKECDALESKRIVVGVEWISNVPSITFGSTTAVS